MSSDASPSPDPETAAPGPQGRRALDVVVCADTPGNGLLRRVRRLLRQCTGEARLIVVDGGGIDEPLWSRLQGLARDVAALLLLRQQGAGGPSSIELAMAHSAGRDVVLLGADVHVFAGFLGGLEQVTSEDERAGLVSPLSNREQHALEPKWKSALTPPQGISAKRWAKLIQRVALRSRPALVVPDPACVLLRRELLDVIGPPTSTDGTAFAHYADEARKHGFSVRLADDVYVQHESEPAHGADDPNHPLGPVLSWHARRGTAKNSTSPLLLLASSPFSAAGPEAPPELCSLLERLDLPRAVLAYPAVGGIEVAEILDGAWQAPLVYKLPLQQPLASFVEDIREAEAALRELLELFQIGFVHVVDLEPWSRVLTTVLGHDSLPYLVSVTDDGSAPAADGAGGPAEQSLLTSARAVLCTSDALGSELCRAYSLKEKRVRSETAAAGAGGVSADDVKLGAWRASYDACRTRAAKRARWLSSEQLRRLRELHRDSRPLSTPPAKLISQAAPIVERWVERIGRRAPGVLRSAWNRLPYGSKQQRKPR